MTTQRLFSVTANVLLIASLALITDIASAAQYPKDGGAPLHSWDENLPSDSPFTVLAAFNNQAVRDNETGLVWERAPVTAKHTWVSGGGISDARTECLEHSTGGRNGWRLPAIAELSTLVDPNATTAPTLPAGNPFTNVQTISGALYWSASTSPDLEGTRAWVVSFNSPKGTSGTFPKTLDSHVWCVRGPMQESVY